MKVVIPSHRILCLLLWTVLRVVDASGPSLDSYNKHSQRELLGRRVRRVGDTDSCWKFSCVRFCVLKENELYAPRDRYPYVVSLQYPTNYQHFCVGTLIHQSWILTYARCLDTKRFIRAVRNPIAALGSENLSGPFKEKHLIKMSIVHPLYNGSEVGPYDVALLKLTKPSMLQPLVTLYKDSPPLLEGLETRALSWSRLESGSPYSKQLVEITGLKLLNTTDCWKVYGYSKQLACLKATRGAVCTGGTGGPIIVPSFPDRLIGMAIESDVCREDAKTSGFVPIQQTREWIWNITAEFQS